MADVRQIIRVFEKKIRGSTSLKDLAKKASKYSDAQEYATKTAIDMMNTLSRFIDVSAITQEEAIEIFTPLLEANYSEVIRICEKVQTQINERAKIGIGVLTPEFNAERARGIGIAITDAEEVSNEYVENLLINNSVSIVDETIKKNFEAQKNMGLKTSIIRRYDHVGLNNRTEVCHWCLARQGSWDDYEEALNAGVFERHPGCGCVIEYTVGKTRSWSNQGGRWQDIDDL